MRCHLLLFGLPVLGLPVFWIFPLPFALALYVPLSALSVWLGIAVTHALQMPVSTGMETLRGRSGRVVRVDGRTLLVQLDGDAELWQAASPAALRPRQAIDVLDVEGLTLVVGPHAADRPGAVSWR